MALFFESPVDTFTIWRGERIQGIAYPQNIEALWSDAKLAAINLYRPAVADPVPVGFEVLSVSVQRVGGVVKYVHVTQAIVPPTSAELDAVADAVAQNVLEDDARTKAMGMVMADLIEQVFGVSQAVARQQVKTRFRDYYRALL